MVAIGGLFFAYRKAKIVPDNLFAFPPSLAVIVRGESRSGSSACRKLAINRYRTDVERVYFEVVQGQAHNIG